MIWDDGDGAGGRRFREEAVLIAIREAVTEDLQALVLMHGLFMEHHVACDERFAVRPGVRETWPGRISAAMDNPEALVLVAAAGSRIVGCAYTFLRPGALDYGPEKVGFLCSVFVDPGSRRQGIARGFLSSSEEWLREKGIRTLEVSWAVRSEEARSTWTSLGIEPVAVSGRMEV